MKRGWRALGIGALLVGGLVALVAIGSTQRSGVQTGERRLPAMHVIQIKVQPMDLFAYLVGDPVTKVCALIDPAFETDRILALVEKEGYRVALILNTHGHPDHTAGNAAIARATGAKVAMHAAEASALSRMTSGFLALMMGGTSSPKPSLLLADGDTVAIGQQRLTVLHTPGHTPGGICLHGAGQVFTGDTLFVGNVGRTDLPGSSFAELRKSILGKLYTLPGETVLWPGHDYGTRPSSTIADEKRTNGAVRAL